MREGQPMCPGGSRRSRLATSTCGWSASALLAHRTLLYYDGTMRPFLDLLDSQEFGDLRIWTRLVSESRQTSSRSR